MILWNTKIRLENQKQIMICQLKKHKVLCYHLTVPVNTKYHFVDAESKKAPRRTPYRLRTENFLIDTYLTNRFLVRKADGAVVFRRLCDIEYDHEFVLLDKSGDWLYEKTKSILQDPAKMRLYDISTNCDHSTQSIAANGFIMKLEKK